MKREWKTQGEFLYLCSRVMKIIFQVSQGMVGQMTARRAAGVIAEMIKVIKLI